MFSSIRQRVLAALILAGLSPLLLILIATHAVTGRALVVSELGRIVDVGDEVARQVAFVAKGAANDLNALAQSPALLSDNRSNVDKKSEFDRLTKNYSHFREIRLYDLDGWEISTSDEDRRRDRTHHFSRAVAGERFVSEPYVPSAVSFGEGEIQLVITIYIPIARDGEAPSAIIKAEIGLNSIWSILNTAKLGGETGAFILLDDRGNILSHPDNEMILSKFSPREVDSESGLETSGTGQHVSAAGESFFHYVRVLEPGYTGLPYKWRLICRQRTKSVTALVQNFQISQLGAGGIATLLVTLFGLILSSKLAHPIVKASSAANAVAAGDLDATMEAEGPKEMKELAVSFNKMVNDLKHHRSHLESLVQSRTKKLHKSQADLENLTAQLRAAYDSIQEAVLVTREGGEVLAANRRMSHFFGIDSERLITEGLGVGSESRERLFKTFDDREAFEKAWSAYTANPDLVGEDEWEVTGEVERQMTIYSAPVKGLLGNTFARLWMFRDMTEQRHLELSLQQSQKMDAIGRLSGGVAHDFNNLLTGIIGSLSLAELEDEIKDKRMLNHLGSAKGAAERAAGIVKQLLTFSRQDKVCLKQCAANKLFCDVNGILAYSIDPSVQIVMQLDEQNPHVIADATQIDQVLMNLCVNARDAMPDGGQLTMSTAVVPLNASQILQNGTIKPGDFVRFAVEDTGTGIPEAIREKIFEPFFTTKEQGKGTGLGLATSYGIIKQHGGWIECHSEVGQGTRFEVYLPFCKAKEADTKNGRTAVKGGNETILIVDDETIVRVVAEGILRRQGYRILSAQDGKEALETVARDPDGIDLIMLDLTMPRLSGKDTFRELRSGKLPHIPVVICSGYLVELDAFEKETGSTPEGAVQKPYDVAFLASEVRSILDQSRAKTV